MAVKYSEKRQSVPQICIRYVRVFHRPAPPLHPCSHKADLNPIRVRLTVDDVKNYRRYEILTYEFSPDSVTFVRSGLDKYSPI